jgi:zinc-ribbon domain
VIFYLATLLIVAGVALFVASPLTGRPSAATKKSADQLRLEHWQHEQALAVQGLREVEFDREMGKLSDADYASLRGALQARALKAMTAIERLKESERAATLAALAAAEHKRAPVEPAAAPPPVEQPHPPAPQTAGPPASSAAPPAAASLGRWAAPDAAWARRARFCPQCGNRVAAMANFCAECGAALRAGEHVLTRAS